MRTPTGVRPLESFAADAQRVMTAPSFRNDAAVIAGRWPTGQNDREAPVNRLLLVDDDPTLRTHVAAGMSARGYACETASDASEARERLDAEEPFDLVLLDVTLPGDSGWSVLEALRSGGDDTPVVFLTGSHTPADRVRGLRLGADDYVAKPFDFEELVARVEAVLRRHRPPLVYELGAVRIDLTAQRATRGDREIELSRREFALVEALVLAHGEVLTRPELLSKVWDMDFDSGTNVVDVVVMRVRKKLDVQGGNAIQTVVGEGYRADARRVKG